MRKADIFRWLGRLGAGALLGALCVVGAAPAAGKACVWRVSDGAGHTLYLAGSVHALRRSDYPLPPEYDKAFAASDALAFETDPEAMNKRGAAALERAGRLPGGVTLRDRLDPRTYAYLQKVVARFHGSDEPLKQIEHLKPWYIAQMLDGPKGNLPGPSTGHGVEAYLLPRARKEGKLTAGLTPLDEHIAVLGGMSDADSEAELLLEFIQLDKHQEAFSRTVAAWRRGDVAAIDQDFAAEYRDAPGLRRRLLADRNQRWLPKIEDDLRSGKTWMIVAGAGHMAGSEGLPALLQARGYRVEQL